MRSAIALVLLLASSSFAAPTPMKVAIIGLEHGHVDGFLQTSPLTPAGGILNRPDIQLVGIVEPDQKLFDSYAARFHLSPNLHFRTIQGWPTKPIHKPLSSLPPPATTAALSKSAPPSAST